MTPNLVLPRLPFELSIHEELQVLEASKSLTLVNVGNTMAKSFLVHRFSEKTKFNNIFWASNDEKADDILPSAQLFFGEKVIMVPEVCDMRTLYKLYKLWNDPAPHVFLFEDLARFMDQKIPLPKVIDSCCLTLKDKTKIKIYECFEALEKMGYRVAEDKILNPGEFVRQGDSVFIYPINEDRAYRISLFGDEIEGMETYQEEVTAPVHAITIYPIEFEEVHLQGRFVDILETQSQSLFISDDLDLEVCPTGDFHKIRFTTFPGEQEQFFHLNFFSVLPFYTIQDFVTEIKERMRRSFDIVILTKKGEELKSIFKEYEVMHTTDLEDRTPSTLKLLELGQEIFLPHSFQNNDRKILCLTDREIFQFHRSSRAKKAISGMNLDLINTLKPGDFVVHLDHGIAHFEGMVRREVQEGIREYLKLTYSGNDRLFVPVESAEKVSKFVGNDDPRLTKLGGAEWQTLQRKMKAETERIAKDLLKLYAQREIAKGQSFDADGDKMNQFYAGFPYEMTPGQLSAWESVRIDMEKQKPMDRLVCGDVGFGKTEIAMRAAFKAFCSGRQSAILAPITILAEQHYQGFLKRVKDQNFNVRIELLSRFQSVAEQKKILKDLEFGLVDIVIGTHRLLSEDVKFKDIGLMVVDEEQRFGVKQKERLKNMKADMDILTLTATPIPRTLHMGLNKLKDVSTITTPPPGRLPVVTEVRKYNLNLICERIAFEIERGGQVYFLHNEVKTIEAQATQMRSLMPKVRFLVAHGQLSPHDLEDRIRQFKEGEADVLIASTIIENGIDLPNANTLFVNRAEKFGLSQLYQLRGRVGRGRTQAYAFFLYKGQKLEIDARKRLRAIVEASDLGSGFQIAMKDLEIRGAGEILGASQSGTMKDAGVSHFMRMLHKTVEEMKSGSVASDIEEEENISVEVPLSAYIPPSFIPSADEKIQVYQELAGAEDLEALEEVKRDLREDYGDLPREVENLTKVITLKIVLREAHLSAVKITKSSHKSYGITLRMGKGFTPDQIFGLLKESPKKWVITANALKISLESLPVTWYQELLADVKRLKGLKK